MVINSKVTLLLLMSTLAANPPPNKMGWEVGGGGSDLISATADNSINGSFAVTVLLDPLCYTATKRKLNPFGVTKAVVRLREVLFKLNQRLTGLQMMPMMSALFEYSSIVGNIVKLCSVRHSVLFYLTQRSIFSLLCCCFSYCNYIYRHFAHVYLGHIAGEENFHLNIWNGLHHVKHVQYM